MPEIEISQPLQKRLESKGPKRILALDGGGIRGALTLGFLGKTEEILSQRYANAGLMSKEKFRLHHYFDLIGGTSTGAIIASLLATTDYSVSEIKQKYIELGKEIFSDLNGLNFFGKQIYFNGKYDSRPLKEQLKKIFNEQRLGDNSNKTGLCIVAKRLDTCSTWPVTNNPKAKFFDQNRFYIRDIVRASTAAPTFFDPEVIDVGNGEEGVFVDGGLSMMNNPSLQLFLVATLKGFNLNWKAGSESMFIVSIGTGRRPKKLVGEKYRDPNLLAIAKMAPDQFMNDAVDLIELMMHYIGKGNGALRDIDLEVGNLSDDIIHGGKAFSYLRYNFEMMKEELKDIGMGNLSDTKIANLMNMDQPDNVNLLIEIGEKAAEKYVDSIHFEKAFDLK